MVAVQVEHPFFVGPGGTAPLQVQGIGKRPGIAQAIVVERRRGVALSAKRARDTDSQHQRVVGIDLYIAAQREHVELAVVLELLESTVAAGHRAESERRAVGRVADARAQVTDAITTHSHVNATLGQFGSMTREDVDRAEKGICTISIGVRAANHLDPVNLVHRERQCIPVNAAEGTRRINRSAIDHDLHLGRKVVTQTVVGDPLIMPALLSDHHPGNETQHTCQIAIAGRLDEAAIDHRCRPRHFGQRLRETRNAQHHRHRVKEQRFGRLRHGMRGRQHCQQHDTRTNSSTFGHDAYRDSKPPSITTHRTAEAVHRSTRAMIASRFRARIRGQSRFATDHEHPQLGRRHSHRGPLSRP